MNHKIVRIVMIIAQNVKVVLQHALNAQYQGKLIQKQGRVKILVLLISIYTIIVFLMKRLALHAIQNAYNAMGL